MDRREKEERIERFVTAYKTVQDKVRGLTREELYFIPDIPDAWSINEHLVHLLDSDALGWYRARAAVADPGAKVPNWSQEGWRNRLGYSRQDGLACLEEAVRLRSILGSWLRTLIDEDWSAFWFEHPVRGRLDLTAYLEMYSGHGDFHVPYIERNLKARRG